MIYSHKHEIGGRRICAEVYEGREVSFMTEKTRELLHKVSGKALLVPVTTRTVEQYRRIDLGIGEIPYALVCNGGVLLTDGREDRGWYEESLERIKDSVYELEKAAEILEEDTERCLEVRKVKGLFLFTKSDAPAKSVERLRQALDSSRVDVFSQGIKVYVVPKELTKGNAVMRLKDRLRAEREGCAGRRGCAAAGEAAVNGEKRIFAIEKVIAAGDSGFDVSMLQCADVGVAPAGLDVGKAEREIVKIGEEVLFSEGMLEWVADRLAPQKFQSIKKKIEGDS